MPFLKETLDSVYNQTYESIEIIVIDDGSSDGSLSYLKGLDRPGLLVKRNKGKGACAARNYGFDLATGDFIQYLDADDLLSPNKVEEQVKLLQRYPKRVAVCSTAHFYKQPINGKIVDKDFMFTTNNPQNFLLKLYGGDGKHYNMVQTSAWLTPKIVIQKAGFWDEALSKDQDGEFFCRVVMASEGVCYTSKALNYYRKYINGQNIASQKQKKHILSQLKALDAKANSLKAYRNSPKYKKAFALQYKLLAIDAYPEFKSVCKTALKKSKELGSSRHLPILGGRIIEGIKYVLGWRTAKLFSYWIHKVI